MANVFKRTAYLQEELFFFKKELGGTPCFFLDTGTGHLSDSQLKWLKLELNHLDSPLSFSCTILPFMVVLLIWIKRIILVNKTALQEILLASGLPTTVFCGYFHCDKTIHYKNIVTHITPSCYAQFDWRHETFKMDHYRIALREIEISDGVIMSSITYFDGNKL